MGISTCPFQACAARLSSCRSRRTCIKRVAGTCGSFQACALAFVQGEDLQDTIASMPVTALGYASRSLFHRKAGGRPASITAMSKVHLLKKWLGLAPRKDEGWTETVHRFVRDPSAKSSSCRSTCCLIRYHTRRPVRPPHLCASKEFPAPLSIPTLDHGSKRCVDAESSPQYV